MKFIYFGSSWFSQIILRELYAQGYVPALIVSKPDKPKGRGLKLLPTEVSQFAQDKNIHLIKPVSLNGSDVGRTLSKERADFFIVADYGEIIPKNLLVIPKIFPLCFHPSLLPRYRGPAPIEAVLMNGEKKSGVTVFKMNQKVDAGDIISQKELTVGYEDDFFSLSQRLARKGALLLIETVDRIKAKDYFLTPQDENLATLTYKLNKESGRILWSNKAQDIRNLIRATVDWPSAYTYYRGATVKILVADIVDREASFLPGTIIDIDKEGIQVAAGKGALKIKKLKPQGKSEMSAWSFVCGYRVKAGELFSSDK